MVVDPKQAEVLVFWNLVSWSYFRGINFANCIIKLYFMKVRHLNL